VPLDLVWRVPERREAEARLYVALRLMRVGGWLHLVVCCTQLGPTFVGLQLAPDAREDDAQLWASAFERRYRVDASVDDLLGSPWRWSEIFLDGGVGAFLERYEWQQHKRRVTWVDAGEGWPGGKPRRRKE
jgi:hypothetical protein